MDPLSLSVSCYTLITAIANLSTQVSGFIRSVRNARGDIDALTRELASLRTVLEVLVGDSTDGNNIPEPIEKQLLGVIANCSQVISQIETSLAKYAGDGVGAGMKWTVTGRDDMEKLRSHLGAHKSTLELALELVNLSINRNIRADTQELRSDTSKLKQDTTLLKQSSAVIVENTNHILEGLDRIRTQIPRPNGELGTNGYVLQNYLDSLTVYTTEVYEASVADLEETLSDDTIQEEQPLLKYLSTNNISSSLVTKEATELSEKESKGGPKEEDKTFEREHRYQASIEIEELANPDPQAEVHKEPQPKDLEAQLSEKDSDNILNTFQTSSPKQEFSSSRYRKEELDAEASQNKKNGLSVIARFNQTISEYIKAVEDDPGNSTYSSNRATAFALMGDLRKALEETVERQKPIKLKDAIGRKFSFPWHLSCTWEGIEDLIRQAFLHVDIIGPRVAAGHYDLIGPNNEIILPGVWETTVEPDWMITMHMWPTPEPQADEAPGTQASKTPPVSAVKDRKKFQKRTSFFFGSPRPGRRADKRVQAHT